MIQRRGFLAAILAAGVAPAFVGSQILMPVKKIIVPEHSVFYETGNENWNWDLERVRANQPEFVASGSFVPPAYGKEGDIITVLNRGPGIAMAALGAARFPVDPGKIFLARFHGGKWKEVPPI